MQSFVPTRHQKCSLSLSSLSSVYPNGHVDRYLLYTIIKIMNDANIHNPLMMFTAKYLILIFHALYKYTEDVFHENIFRNRTYKQTLFPKKVIAYYITEHARYFINLIFIGINVSLILYIYDKNENNFKLIMLIRRKTLDLDIIL